MDAGDAPNREQPDQRYVYGSYVDELIFKEGEFTDSTTSEILFYHRNQQYSIVALTDEEGEVVERYAYTAYGETTILDANGNEIDETKYANPYTYTGRRADEELGLLYFRARYYDPATGEFISRDPLEYVDGMSQYRACFVPGRVDPSGLCSEEPECKVKDLSFTLSGEIPKGTTFGMEATFIDDESKSYGCECCSVTLQVRWNKIFARNQEKERPTEWRHTIVDGKITDSTEYNLNGAPHAGFAPDDTEAEEWHQDRDKRLRVYGSNKVGCKWTSQDTPSHQPFPGGEPGAKLEFRLVVFDTCSDNPTEPIKKSDVIYILFEPKNSSPTPSPPKTGGWGSGDFEPNWGAIHPWKC